MAKGRAGLHRLARRFDRNRFVRNANDPAGRRAGRKAYRFPANGQLHRAGAQPPVERGRPCDLGSQQGGNPRRDLGRRRQRCRGHPDAAAPAPVAPDACGELHPERRRKLMEEHWGWGDGIVMSTFADMMLKPVVRTWRSASTRGCSCSASRGQAIQDLGPARREMGRRPRAQHSDRRAGDHRLRGWRQAREIV